MSSIRPTKKLGELATGVIFVIFAIAFFYEQQYWPSFFALLLLIVLLKLQDLKKFIFDSSSGFSAEFSGLREILNRDDNILETNRETSFISENKINQYVAKVIQVGGIDSHLFTKTAYILEDGGVYLNPPDKWISIGFNRGGDVMWVSCKEGFKIDSYSSPTGNILLTDSLDIGSCGILLEDKLKNEISITCSKKK